MIQIWIATIQICELILFKQLLIKTTLYVTAQPGVDESMHFRDIAFAVFVCAEYPDEYYNSISWQFSTSLNYLDKLNIP